MKHTNIEYNGVVYADRKALGLAFGLTTRQISDRLSKGWSLEKTLTTPMAEPARPKEVTFEGILYPSLNALCREQEVDASAVQKRMVKGETVEEAITNIKERANKMPVVYKGVEYSSKTALFKKLGLSTSVMSRRLKNGMSLEEAIKTPIISCFKKVVYKDVEYPSLKALGEAFGIPMDIVHSRNENGWSIEQIVETPVASKPNELMLVYKGKEYTCVELAKKAGLTRETLYDRVKAGWSVEDAVKTPLTEHSISIEFEGKTFPSLCELARAYNVLEGTLISRRNKGWPLYECVYGRKRTDKRGKQIDKMMEEILFENAISKRRNTGAYQNAVSNIIAVNSTVV